MSDPFLWNAAIHDTTQWPGFAKNGEDIHGLARNVGEVYSVFEVYHPTKSLVPGVVNFLDHTSLNFPGLMRLETLIKKIGPPKWPCKIDPELVAVGKKIFERDPKDGGCALGRHEIKNGEPGVCNPIIWKTPLQDVGTDDREYQVLSRSAQTGVLEGVCFPFVPLVVNAPIQHKDTIINVLSVSVAGSILAAPLHFGPEVFEPLAAECPPIKPANTEALLKMPIRNLTDLYKMNGDSPSPVFESWVLEGIWATAPYLHNGSVLTLVELLKPPADRVASFKVGQAYDIEKVGLAKDQTGFDFTLQTTDCGIRDSGNSRCGHDFGAKLSLDEKKSLLEYLKHL